MPDSPKQINKLLDKVDKVIESQKKLEKKQEVILAAVATDENKEEQIQTEVTQMETIGKQITTANTFHSNFIVRASRHQFLFPIIIIVGVVLVWKGLWGLFDQLPIVSYSVISLLLGLAILWIFNRIRAL